MANPRGKYILKGSTSHLEQVQAITTLRSGKVVDNHVEEKKDEQTKAPQNLHLEKGNDASSSSTPILEIPYKP